MLDNHYCNNLFSYGRRISREVNVGGISMGGEWPIRIQSMTTVDTMDTKALIDQIIRLLNIGCEYVRVSVPSIKEAQHLVHIKEALVERNYDVPLIADVHFTPNAAEYAAKIVEKVRINPGNYADKKKFQRIEYTDSAYQSELERIEKKFMPLVMLCAQHDIAMRIGSNHGSLSDRIMSRYGDTPLGMVESALEFVRICESVQYYNLVLSMKASNPRIMVYAYRLLSNRIRLEGLHPYPFHLGVTEAGEGEEGRVKSAMGIGALLEDGLGDTIRVSLTEEPEAEIIVAKILSNRYTNRITNVTTTSASSYPIQPFTYQRRVTQQVVNFGGGQHPCVIVDCSSASSITIDLLNQVGYHYISTQDKWENTDRACDYIYVGSQSVSIKLPQTLSIICDYASWLKNKDQSRTYPLMSMYDYMICREMSDTLNFVRIFIDEISAPFIQKIKKDSTVVLFLYADAKHVVADQRKMFVLLMKAMINAPVVIVRQYTHVTPEELLLYASIDVGSLFIDGLGDGIFVIQSGITSEKVLNDLMFEILQAARMRTSKAEYISCPSCGRTLFSLQEATAKIRAKTQHLRGIKIGIMGCIVNGPGEMADADYGYVGSGYNKITLYKGKDIVKRNVSSERAVEELVNLIKEDGRWMDAKEIL